MQLHHDTQRRNVGRAALALLSIGTIASLALGGLLSGARAETAPASSATPQAALPHGDVKVIQILLARELRDDRLPPLSLLDLPPKDDGVAGARLAIDDNNTTGRFLKQQFTLDTVENADPAALVEAVKAKVAATGGFVVTDASADTLLKLSDALAGTDTVIFNAGAADERLREEDCRVNIKHTAPSYSMLADALSQYLAVKRWRRWLLVRGTQPDDELYAEALRRSAKRFGHRIVEERQFKYEVGSRRTDGGYEQVQQQIPSFLQGAAEHDIVIVADPGNLVADYFPFRTWEPRPVAGSAGLVAVSWHPAVELWGGTQFQNRFKRIANRTMRELDYNVWMAVRSVGEAATRRRSAVPKELISYLLQPEFELAAFKGRKLTYRSWNGQLRQPVLIATDKLHVTVSPQPEFLHQFSELDTLGVDKPETRCQAFAK
ncbi:MAG: ABC transporter substrate-binding protein [Hyphomicrobiaceae bacterium]